MSDYDRINSLNEKINVLETHLKDLMDVKIGSVSKECNDIYDQLTSLRNTIQEIYAEISESNRFQSGNLMSFQTRIDAISENLKMLEKNKTTNTGYMDLSSLNLRKTISVVSAAVIGSIIVIGGTVLAVVKFVNLVMGLFQ